jgi:CheY-like chemotaxis protein
MDGFSVCRILKGQETTQLIPIVIMTALDAKEDRIKGIEAGADDFLTKPVDRRELLARIQAAVKMKQAVDRLKEQIVLDNTFHREGEYWTIAYQGKVVRIKDSSGLGYLSYLLRYPHKEIHVLTLVASVEGQLESVLLDFKELSTQIGLGDAGEILDVKAKADYKQRLRELREELEDAQRCNDMGRVAKTERELEILTQELLHAVGFGGKDRRAASPAERARVNVQRAIKAALLKLSVYLPILGRELESIIKTGMYCSYTPDLSIPSPWRL